VLALVLGLIVSAGLYFAYLWPSVEPVDDEPAHPAAPPAGIPDDSDGHGDDTGDGATSPAP
jgi:hypothetical protein